MQKFCDKIKQHTITDKGRPRSPYILHHLSMVSVCKCVKRNAFPPFLRSNQSLPWSFQCQGYTRVQYSTSEEQEDSAQQLTTFFLKAVWIAFVEIRGHPNPGTCTDDVQDWMKLKCAMLFFTMLREGEENIATQCTF